MIKDLILRKCFSKFQEAWSLKPSTELDEATIFEKFVNYVILSQDEVSTFVGHPELLDFCCTGGGDDAKLDGLGIKINGQLVGSTDEVDQIVNLSKKVEVEFFAVQSKERTDFDSSAVNTFGIGLRNFFSPPSLPENEKIKAIRIVKDYIFNNDKIIRKLVCNPSINIYYVFCGQTPDDKHTKAVKDLLIEGLKSCPDCLGDIRMEYVDAEQLTKKCNDLENEFKTELNIRDIIPLTVSNNTLIKKAYAFTCEASELLKLLTREDKTIRRSLFDNNVRDYLGNKGGINSEIEQTITNEPEMFLMCNNGITIVCSDFIQIKDKLVSIDNPQIVNGCQTSSTIFEQRDNESLNKVQVLVKLICTEDNSITNKIVRGTNKQNQVLEENFEATKPFHQMLEKFFEAKNDIEKLYYERRNKQYSSVPTINRFQIVNLRVVTQLFVATFLQKPYEGHIHESVLLQKYSKKCNENEVFNENHSPYPYYIASLIWYKFEDALRRGIIPTKEFRPYISHLYYIFMFTTGQYPVSADSTKKGIESFCDKLEKLLLSSKLDDTIKKVAAVFSQCVLEWEKQGKNRHAIKDNKEFTDLETVIARRVFVNKSKQIEVDTPHIPSRKWYIGEILCLKYDTFWFAFIKTSDLDENVYFDKRNFSGEVRKLVPGAKVKFTLATRNENENVQYYAPLVQLI